jgi:hypothetical protein
MTSLMVTRGGNGSGNCRPNPKADTYDVIDDIVKHVEEMERELPPKS